MEELDFTPSNVVDTIVEEFFPYRGFELINKSSVTKDSIGYSMDNYGYIELYGINKKNKRGNREMVIFIILRELDNVTFEIKKIKKIVDDVDIHEYTKNNTLDELFIVMDSELLRRKNFIDVITELLSRQKINDTTGISPYYTICPYQKISENKTNTMQIPKHRVLSKVESDIVLNHFEIRYKKPIPAIIINDPPIIWEGGRIGDIIEIIRPSEVAGEAYYYRKVEEHNYLTKFLGGK